MHIKFDCKQVLTVGTYTHMEILISGTKFIMILLIIYFFENECFFFLKNKFDIPSNWPNTSSSFYLYTLCVEG